MDLLRPESAQSVTDFPRGDELIDVELAPHRDLLGVFAPVIRNRRYLVIGAGTSGALFSGPPFGL